MAKIKLSPRVASEAIITNIVTPHDTNHLGTLFGGTLMAWIDSAAGICAMRYAKSAKEAARGKEASEKASVTKKAEETARVKGASEKASVTKKAEETARGKGASEKASVTKKAEETARGKEASEKASVTKKAEETARGKGASEKASVTKSRVSAVVTAAVDALQFAQPVRLGWIVTAMARINYVGNTSCEVGVRVVAEDMQSGVTVHAASAYLTMVALDAQGRPTPLPPLAVRSANDKRRRRAAETRRAMRLALQRRTAAEAKT